MSTSESPALSLSSRCRVLYIAHSHPSQEPGGAQQYALELYEALRASEEFEPVLLARAVSKEIPPHLGTPIRLVNRDPNQYFIDVKLAHFDSWQCNWCVSPIQIRGLDTSLEFL
jgi:hypothetical protein